MFYCLVVSYNDVISSSRDAGMFTDLERVRSGSTGPFAMQYTKMDAAPAGLGYGIRMRMRRFTVWYKTLKNRYISSEQIVSAACQWSKVYSMHYARGASLFSLLYSSWRALPAVLFDSVVRPVRFSYTAPRHCRPS